MKRNAFFLCIVLLCFTGGSVLFAQDDVKSYPSCPYCGMDRQRFAQSRMLIAYAEETTIGVCSIHCAASEISVNRGKTLVSMYVADYLTRNLISAEKCPCHTISMNQGNCTCGNEMVKAKVIKVAQGTADFKAEKWEKAKAFKTVGKYTCDCSSTCKCGTISQNPGKCTCGAEMKKL